MTWGLRLFENKITFLIKSYYLKGPKGNCLIFLKFYSVDTPVRTCADGGGQRPILENQKNNYLLLSPLPSSSLIVSGLDFEVLKTPLNNTVFGGLVQSWG